MLTPPQPEDPMVRFVLNKFKSHALLAKMYGVKFSAKLEDKVLQVGFYTKQVLREVDEMHQDKDSNQNTQRAGKRNISSTLLVEGVPMKLFDRVGLLFDAEECTIRGYMYKDGQTTKDKKFGNINVDKAKFEPIINKKQFAKRYAEKFKEFQEKNKNLPEGPHTVFERYNEVIANVFPKALCGIIIDDDKDISFLKALIVRAQLANKGKHVPMFLYQGGQLIHYNPTQSQILSLLKSIPEFVQVSVKDEIDFLSINPSKDPQKLKALKELQGELFRNSKHAIEIYRSILLQTGYSVPEKMKEWQINLDNVKNIIPPAGVASARYKNPTVSGSLYNSAPPFGDVNDDPIPINPNPPQAPAMAPNGRLLTTAQKHIKPLSKENPTIKEMVNSNEYFNEIFFSKKDLEIFIQTLALELTTHSDELKKEKLLLLNLLYASLDVIDATKKFSDECNALYGNPNRINKNFENAFLEYCEKLQNHQNIFEAIQPILKKKNNIGGIDAKVLAKYFDKETKKPQSLLDIAERPSLRFTRLKTFMSSILQDQGTGMKKIQPATKHYLQELNSYLNTLYSEKSENHSKNTRLMRTIEAKTLLDLAREGMLREQDNRAKAKQNKIDSLDELKPPSYSSDSKKENKNTENKNEEGILAADANDLTQARKHVKKQPEQVREKNTSKKPSGPK
jgi:hypothetical protein